MFRIILANREHPIVIFPTRGAEVHIIDLPSVDPYGHVLQLIQGDEG